MHSDEEDRQILFMQVRLMNMTSKKLGISMKAAAELFEKYNVLSFIRECWGIFHVEGDDAVFLEITEFLKQKGASI